MLEVSTQVYHQFEGVLREIQDDGLLVYPEMLLKLDKNRFVSVFVVDTLTRKMCCSSKDTVVKSLTSLGVKSQRSIKGKGYFMWDVLLPTSSNCEDASSRDLITKDNIIRTEYEDRRMSKSQYLRSLSGHRGQLGCLSSPFCLNTQCYLRRPKRGNELRDYVVS